MKSLQSIKELVEDVWYYLVDLKDSFSTPSNSINWNQTPFRDEFTPQTIVGDNSSTLYIEKVISDLCLACKVVEFDSTSITIEIIQIYWDRLGSYLDVGETYKLDYLDNDTDWILLEVPADQMKRCTSQVLLNWSDNDWCWDIDS